jgi:WD40 repeat protein
MDEPIRCLDVANDKERDDSLIEPKAREVFVGCTFSRNGRLAFVMTSRGDAQIWDVQSGEKLRDLGRYDTLTTGTFALKNDMLVVCPTGVAPIVLDLNSGARISTLASYPRLHPVDHPNIVISPDGRFVGTYTCATRLRFWRVGSGLEIPMEASEDIGFAFEATLSSHGDVMLIGSVEHTTGRGGATAWKVHFPVDVQ